MSIFDELKRRNVFRVSIAYIITAWLLLQVIDLVLENVNAPDWVMQVFMLALAIGFPLAVFFAWAFEMTPEGIRKEKDVDRSQSITTQTGRKMDRNIIIAMALALSWFAWDKFAPSPEPATPAAETLAVQTEPEVTPEPMPDLTGPEPAAPAKSIAVLPFTNMSEDASNEYFSDGISEEILNALAKVKELKVAGRTSSFAFKGRNEDLRLIGKTLGVSHILEGSVRKAGNKVRITAQLIQVDDGFHLWSDTYDRELTDIFAIQDEIAGAILKELKAALIGGQQIASTRADTQAYDLYLLARQRIYTRTRMQMESALDLLNQAIEIDPDFAPAWAQKGITSLLLSDRDYGTIPLVESLAQGRLALNKALEIDPGLAEGWAGLGLYQSNHPVADENALAIASLRKALAINPSLINASNWLQNELNRKGQPREALQILEDMLDRDPLYKPGIGNAVITYLLMGNPEKATGLVERARPFLTDDPYLVRTEASILNFAGRSGESVPLAEFAYQRAPSDGNSYVSLAVALSLSNQFERLAKINTPFPGFRINALLNLDRSEEATILAYQWANSGQNPGNLFYTLVKTAKFEEMIAYLEQRWPDLNALESAFPARFGFGYPMMITVAHAYRHSGNQLKFDQAMSLVRIAHEQQSLAGADSSVFYVPQARYWMLAGDDEKAMDFLQKSADKGGMATPRLSDLYPLFKPLEGKPRYEAIQKQMLKHLNAERAKLNLEPLEMDRA
jgi:TolB-like protein/Tfp pilus assembly protein PilF